MFFGQDTACSFLKNKGFHFRIPLESLSLRQDHKKRHHGRSEGTAVWHSEL